MSHTNAQAHQGPFFIRKPAVCKALGLSAATVYRHVHDGLIPPPIPLGGRSVGWLNTEIEAVIRLRLSGADDEKVKSLVDHLVSARCREVAL